MCVLDIVAGRDPLQVRDVVVAPVPVFVVHLRLPRKGTGKEELALQGVYTVAGSVDRHDAVALAIRGGRLYNSARVLVPAEIGDLGRTVGLPFLPWEKGRLVGLA